MTLRHLKIFVTVCEVGSTIAAGEKLNIAQPSISLAISELEDYYGIKLFDRIAKRLHITEAGKRFLQYATHIVTLFEDMEKEVKNFDSIGVIRIGTSITIGNYLLPKYVSAFKQMRPQMDAKVIIDNSDTIQQLVLSNQLDIGLIEGIVHSSYLVAHKFAEDKLVMICANQHTFANHKIELSQLCNERLILREAGSAGREIFESLLRANGIEISPAWESTSTQAIVRAVTENLGVSVLPYLLVKDFLDRNEISQFFIEGIELKRDFCVIHHRNKYLTDSTKDFLTLVNKKIPPQL